jgi:hypothetical protein
MRTITVMFCSLLLAISAGDRALAQDSSKPAETAKATEGPIHYFHLQFSVQELGADGKPTNSREYSTVVSTDPADPVGTIRTGSRVPIATGTQENNGKIDYQFQYIDVGVHIDTRRVSEVGRMLSFHLSAEISRLAEGAPTTIGDQKEPVIRQDSWQASVIVPLDKPTAVFTSDALEYKGRMQLVVTATAVP